MAPDAPALDEVVARLVSGELRVHIDDTFPLEAVRDTHMVGEGGHVRGKLALRIAC